MRKLRKKFVIFCEGDTEFHYMDQMRKNQGDEISLQPINMKGGGYASFLNEIRTRANTNCIAKFIIVDADRISRNKGEKNGFLELMNYCRLQNQKRAVPHFLIVNNPDFEFIACLHNRDYRGQSTNDYIVNQFGFKNLIQFKNNADIYNYLNSKNNSYLIMLDQIRKGPKIIKNNYVINKKMFEIEIKNTELDLSAQRG